MTRDRFLGYVKTGNNSRIMTVEVFFQKNNTGSFVYILILKDILIIL